MTRADALAALIERVEAGDTWDRLDVEMVVGALGTDGGASNAVASLSSPAGSLDAVARLEAPLRDRGWEGPYITAPTRVTAPLRWEARWSDGKSRSIGAAPTEARARLLAVLRALRHEALSTPTPEARA